MPPLRPSGSPRRHPRRRAAVLTTLLVTAAVAALALDRLDPGDQAPGADLATDLTVTDLTPGERAKLARAREAIAAAEAAGTRWIESPTVLPVRFTAADAARKLQRARDQQPQARSWTPGVPEAEQGGAP